MIGKYFHAARIRVLKEQKKKLDNQIDRHKKALQDIEHKEKGTHGPSK
jgi:chaperonin cofactor prefoldin|tara:strand:- start:101 stop:244 length:144 start_codon:yes stop_codon:yes gene_type:complete